MIEPALESNADSLILVTRETGQNLNPIFVRLQAMVLQAVTSPNTARNYTKALDEVFSLCVSRAQGLSRALLMEYRASMLGRGLSPSTINVRLSAVRKLISEVRKNGILDAGQAVQMADVPNVPQQGTRMGNWLTREQARELLTVPDRSTKKGQRDYCILALLVGCALRRRELAELKVEDVQLRENRWVIADLCGKGGRIRTVAVPMWVKQGIDSWASASGIDSGRLLRPLSKSGRILGDELSDWAIWSVVEVSAKEIGVEHFGAHDLRRYAESRIMPNRKSHLPKMFDGRGLSEARGFGIIGPTTGFSKTREAYHPAGSEEVFHPKV